MTTISKISEQIKRLLSGNPSYNIEISNSEIKLLVVQVTNSILRVEKASNLQMGDIFPPSAVIATYDSIQVKSYGTRSISILPAYPLSLPKNMGVWQVADMTSPDTLFIPLLSGQWGVAKTMNYLPSLSGIIGYENEGLNIIYITDITKKYPNPVALVRIKLLISDVSGLGDYDLLPITPEMEVEVIKSVFQLLVNEPVYTHFDDGKDPRQPVNIKR
ncbi:MAG: hypothetical protein ACREHG_06715 [Candidatus Saccharimonadales bacterium]